MISLTNEEDPSGNFIMKVRDLRGDDAYVVKVDELKRGDVVPTLLGDVLIFRADKNNGIGFLRRIYGSRGEISARAVISKNGAVSIRDNNRLYCNTNDSNVRIFNYPRGDKRYRIIDKALKKKGVSFGK